MNVRTKLVTAVSVAIMAAAGSAVADVTLYDYTEATSAYEDAYVSGNLNAADGNQPQASYNADLNVNYERTLSSPNRNVGIKAGAAGIIKRSSAAGAGSTSSYSARAGITADNYFRPNTKTGFWYGAASAAVVNGTDQNGNDITANDIFSKASIGLGYGRVVVVTPMAKAIRLVEALNQRGVLKAAPSKATYQTIAQIISRESEYRSKHGVKRYDQYWIADIEKALMASGQVGNFDASGVLEAQQVLIKERFSERRTGWLVRAGVGAVLSTADDSDAGDPLFEVGAEFHRPLNNQAQFSNVADFTSTFGDETGYNFDNNMSFTREISDKVDWENSWLLSYKDFGNDNDSTTNTLTSEFIYDLDNQLSLTVKGLASKQDSADVDTALKMGVTYRLR